VRGYCRRCHLRFGHTTTRSSKTIKFKSFQFYKCKNTGARAYCPARRRKMVIADNKVF
jgi:hypothetical protein